MRIITAAAKSSRPFFLYFALTGPHAPIIPNDAFKGRSGVGDYGDFVMEMDWTVGEVMKALERTGLADNTLVVFTSDNGPAWWNYEEAQIYGHFSMGPLRGLKQDIWEGGHREAFIVRWPGKVKAGTVSRQLVSHVDMMATCADLLGVRLPDDAGEDSISFLPVLLGKKADKPLREALVHHAGNSHLAIRKGKWVFIDAKNGDAGLPEPQWFKRLRGYEEDDLPGELYNLNKDLAERTNLYAVRPEVVQELKELLHKYIRDGRSTPGTPQKNDTDIITKYKAAKTN